MGDSRESPSYRRVDGQGLKRGLDDTEPPQAMLASNVVLGYEDSMVKLRKSGDGDGDFLGKRLCDISVVLPSDEH